MKNSVFRTLELLVLVNVTFDVNLLTLSIKKSSENSQCDSVQHFDSFKQVTVHDTHL